MALQNPGDKNKKQRGQPNSSEPEPGTEWTLGASGLAFLGFAAFVGVGAAAV